MLRCNINWLCFSWVLILVLLLSNENVKGFIVTKATTRCHDGRPCVVFRSSAKISNEKFSIDPPSSSRISQWQRPTTTTTSRRDALLQSLKTSIAIVIGTTTAITTACSTPAQAASQARVAVWPGLEYLEPVYELQLSVSALSKAVPDPTKWPYLQQRLDKFFGGGLFSERNYYAGLGVQYMNQVEYDKNEIPEYVKLDKEERFQAMESTLQALESFKTHLTAATSPKDTSSDGDGGDKNDVEATKAVLQSDVDQAQASLNRWFSLVPKSDLDRVAQLFVAVREADVDRNGRIDDQELNTLSEEDRAIWKNRIDYVGG